MKPPSESDASPAHAHFSASCFNEAWKLIDMDERSEEQNLSMIDLVHASIWHWRQRKDCTSANLSIGYWQASRAYALIGEAKLARYYGEKSLELTGEGDLINRAFAHEAIARAEMVAGNKEAMGRHLDQAKQLAGTITDAEDRAWVVQNLETVTLDK